MEFQVGDVIIRESKFEDAPEIASVHLNSWRETYTGLLPQEFIDELPLTFKRRMLRWQKIKCNFVFKHPMLF